MPGLDAGFSGKIYSGVHLQSSGDAVIHMKVSDAVDVGRAAIKHVTRLLEESVKCMHDKLYITTTIR